MQYRIYPTIGIARVGNSDEFYIGPEVPGSVGTELDSTGMEVPVTEYKTGDTGNAATSFQMKRQAARFRLYQFDLPGDPGRPAALPVDARIEWSVRLVNKKDAVQRPPDPPAAPTPITIVSGREDRVIDSGVERISTADVAPRVLAGQYLGRDVPLGALRFDPSGNLLVLGGTGSSRTFENASIGADFYNNPGWHDDVSDGPVTAKIVFADGTEAIAEPSWVVVGPPDFAPAVQGVVTLYDTMLQAAITSGLVSLPTEPSFTEHILPLIERARGLQWVHADVAWPAISSNFRQLSDSSSDASVITRRTNAVRGVLRVEQAFSHSDYTFRLRAWQRTYLEKFRTGQFVPDFETAAIPDPFAPSTLNRVVLEGAVGEGFFPGIEAGIILTDTAIYSTPFEYRIDHNRFNAGDLTALMALPWQADFLKCRLGWWPSQRPNQVPGPPSSRPDWDRGIKGHQDLVDRVMMLGVVTRRSAGPPEVQEESRRDPLMDVEVVQP
jgi:hypothetical protein